MKPQGQGRGQDRGQNRDWRKIHHSPMFWIGVVMCLAAIMIYVLSDDLSWRPAAR
jgi:hypothetical protein